jgi:prepilin-type N-terminal cleavage/methylation domain-containing protein
MYCWLPIYPRKRNRDSGFSPLDKNIQRDKRHYLTGFTLIEILIVSAIFSVVAIAIYSTFASGMNIWRRVENVSLLERKINLRLEKMSCELRQSLNFADIGFEGSKEGLTFALLVDGEICEVCYLFDLGQKVILRREDRFEDILQDKVSRPRRFLFPIEEFELEYLCFDDQEDEYIWKDDWEKQKGIPLAVKIRLKYKDEIRTSTVFIPIA